MTTNYGYGYGYTPQNSYTPQFQNLFNQSTQAPTFTIIFVSNIAEAIATKPDVTGKPLFFYNKSEEEFYIKQYDNIGLAPLKTYKLVVENNEAVSNPVLDSIKILDNKITDIKKLLTPEVIEKGNKKNERTA